MGFSRRPTNLTKVQLRARETQRFPPDFDKTKNDDLELKLDRTPETTTKIERQQLLDSQDPEDSSNKDTQDRGIESLVKKHERRKY